MEHSIDGSLTQSDDAVVMLLADDSKPSHFLLSAILKKFSCELDSAMNGAEAVEKFKTRSYDLVFMDSHMPVMDGMTAIREIREIERLAGAARTPIVMMTADDSPEDIENGLAAGASDYLIKPISKESVASTISKFFETDDPQPEVAASAPEESTHAIDQAREAISGTEIMVYVDEEIKELIPGYLERKKQDVKAIFDALNKGDFDTLKVKGHTLKGSGGGYGFDELTAIGTAIEDAAKIANTDAIRTQAEKMLNYLNNVKVIVK